MLLLIHGMAGTCESWQAVIEPLAQRHTVIAPDLPGHGESETGGGDYSLGALAAGLRDLLAALGHERATLVGHSLGGGIAMQFAYQFPELSERLVLVSSGGLGPEVNPVLRPRRCRREPVHRRDRWAGARGRIGASARPREQSGCGRAPTSPRSPAGMHRSPTPDGAARSWRRCAPSLVPKASSSRLATGCTWPPECRC